jgi:AraC family transcriptional regulator, transcriptional activator of pobA
MPITTEPVSRDPSVLPELILHDGARLFVASRRLLDPPMLEVHRYAFYGLAWLSGGAASFVCDTERFEVAAGSLVCTAPGQVNRWERPDADAQIILLGFVPEIFTGGALDVRLISDLPLFKPDGTTVIPASGEVGAALETLFRQVWQRYTQSASPGPANPWRVLPRQREGLLLAYLHAILAEAATLEIGLPSLQPNLQPSQSADLRLTRLFRIHAVGSALERRSVAHYAALLNVTPDHLARAVGRVTGKSPSVWLQERLLLEATRLLTFTNRPVERIAEELHFPTATQFSQWFRTRSGQTPRQVRQGALASAPTQDIG